MSTYLISSESNNQLDQQQNSQIVSSKQGRYLCAKYTLKCKIILVSKYKCAKHNTKLPMSRRCDMCTDFSSYKTIGTLASYLKERFNFKYICSFKYLPDTSTHRTLTV